VAQLAAVYAILLQPAHDPNLTGHYICDAIGFVKTIEALTLIAVIRLGTRSFDHIQKQSSGIGLEDYA
jgi:hypothetical protein